MSILIVDDSMLNLAYLRHVLTEAGYEDIQTAYSAEAALERLGMDGGKVPRKAAPFDLILLDIVMPDMDGIEACRLIKNCPPYSDLPIIFLTGDRRHFKEAFGAGGMDFIEKGAPEYELLARVQSAIRLKQETDIRKSRETGLIKELHLAKRVQKSVLPPPFVEPDIQIHSQYIQSDEVSGDMFYWTRIDENRCGVILIDVAGHGLSSALISMSVRSLLAGMVKRLAEPVEVCRELNKQILSLFGGKRGAVYLTAIYLLIDIPAGEIRYFNAGHPPGLLFCEDRPAQYLEGTGVPLGLRKTLKGESGVCRFDGASKILLYTDGLVETPRASIRDGIRELETYSSRIRYLPNERFTEKLAERGRGKEDDVCIVSIQLG
ncbi:fused response regulator/phosphatase [Saccharibacillus sp. CPCC 101409]|uniref:PP2C family protein-serine/threonine phosphatase n=1 Tax=Saccharibacillus sp. CPCC 101409 TaxID=3058041 RepID=UPI0026721E76|nr:fused response regulator/phosphatase [Saccharibacillus sp. CPCC 101409]MDO3409110.1 fused response regulator/phosphatase [Saccharibacillus sp. CPCC 101409]